MPKQSTAYSPMELTPAERKAFQETVWEYYRQHGRELPWRFAPTPYRVLVSELMLQQTQVSRVIPKYEAFLIAFPDIDSLAAAPLSDVIKAWSGLGYNRRAKYLHLAAQHIARQGMFPGTLEGLTALPGVGRNTAGAILAYAFNQPVAYVETNIRTVYLHHFFGDSVQPVDDKEVLKLVEQTMDGDEPRHWYAALMDYGTHLKKVAGGRLSQSRHYKKQSPLKGSMREMRGKILKSLSMAPADEPSLYDAVRGDERFGLALRALADEGMVEQEGTRWRLTGQGKSS